MAGNYDDDIDETEILGYRLVLTCGACPEQYDVYRGKQNVGYLRLRHGRFTADCPFGNTIYVAHPEGGGAFEHHERDKYLTEAVAAIDKELGSWLADPPEQEDD